MEKENAILALTFDFALEVVSYCELLEEKKRFVVAHQLLKSGTAIGANVREAQGAESKADFIHKLKIAYKEAEETEYWLLLCKHSPSYPNPDGLLEKLVPIKKLFSSIISTSKNNLR